jgi:hypothetical protein
MQKLGISMLIAIFSVASFVHADAALGYDGFIAPTETGYVVAQTDQFFIEGLAVGDAIDATLTWENANADLDLRYTPPGGSCTVLPTPDVNCLSGNVPARIAGLQAGCTYPGDHSTAFIGGQTSASFHKLVTAAGRQEVDVEAAWVNPVTDGGVSYHLEISVNGVQRDISQDTPTTINYINANGQTFCHLP